MTTILRSVPGPPDAYILPEPRLFRTAQEAYEWLRYMHFEPRDRARTTYSDKTGTYHARITYVPQPRFEQGWTVTFSYTFGYGNDNGGGDGKPAA